MTRLTDLFPEHGQSPWIDDLKRSYVRQGGLEELMPIGIRGVTSNPTIMTKAIEAGTDYDEQFGELVACQRADRGRLLGARARRRRPVRSTSCGRCTTSSDGGDGFVSVEVAPDLAHDTDGTIAAAPSPARADRASEPAREDPGDAEGLPAIEETIAAGRKINVTLIFSLERYEAVIEAYLAGLERLVAAGGSLPRSPRSPRSLSAGSTPRSTAGSSRSRPTSRIAAGETRPRAPRHGRTRPGAASPTRSSSERFSSPRFTTLEAGAPARSARFGPRRRRRTRPIPDLLYVDGLIGPDTVNTMPTETAEAFNDHGIVPRTVDAEGRRREGDARRARRRSASSSTT